MFLASIAPTFRLFLLCNLLYGLGVPITAMVTIAMLWSHFPAHKGLIVGFLLSALVMSSSISSFLMPMLVNPRNLDPDIVIYNGVVSNHLYSEQIAMRLPFTMRGLAFLYLFYTIIAIPLFIPLKPSESEFRSTFEENKCGTLRTGLTHRIFICMYSIGFLSTSYGLYMSSVYKNFGQEEISDDKFFTWVNIMNSISSASFRVLCAALSDKFGFHRVFPWILCVQLILGYTYYFSRSSQVLFLLANALSMGCEGGVISTLVGLCGETFGKMMGVKVYSILYTSFITSLLFSIALQAVVLSKIGYFYMFLIVTSLNWISLGLLRVMPKECPWRAEHKEVLIEFPNREDN